MLKQDQPKKILGTSNISLIDSFLTPNGKQLWERFAYLIVPLIIALLLTVIIVIFQLDMKVARLIVSPEHLEIAGKPVTLEGLVDLVVEPGNHSKIWPGMKGEPWATIYHIASWPSLVLTILAVIVMLGSMGKTSLKIHRKKALFILLTLALGPGLIVNVMLKDNLGRARPREVIGLGGEHSYTEAWQRGETGANSSFPSGHAAVGFFLMTPYFLFRKTAPLQARCFLYSGIGWGSLVSLARIYQGGHFLSDTLWAGVLVYLTGGVLALALAVDTDQAVEGRKE